MLLHRKGKATEGGLAPDIVETGHRQSKGYLVFAKVNSARCFGPVKQSKLCQGTLPQGFLRHFF